MEAINKIAAIYTISLAFNNDGESRAKAESSNLFDIARHHHYAILK